jgi:hypothetical protein
VTFFPAAIAATEPGSLSMVFREENAGVAAAAGYQWAFFTERWESGGVADWLAPIDAGGLFSGVAAVQACTVAVTYSVAYVALGSGGPLGIAYYVDGVMWGAGGGCTTLINGGVLTYHAAIDLAEGAQLTAKLINEFDANAYFFDAFLSVEVLGGATLTPESTGT